MATSNSVAGRGERPSHGELIDRSHQDNRVQARNAYLNPESRQVALLSTRLAQLSESDQASRLRLYIPQPKKETEWIFELREGSRFRRFQQISGHLHKNNLDMRSIDIAGKTPGFPINIYKDGILTPPLTTIVTDTKDLRFMHNFSDDLNYPYGAPTLGLLFRTGLELEGTINAKSLRLSNMIEGDGRLPDGNLVLMGSEGVFEVLDSFSDLAASVQQEISNAEIGDDLRPIRVVDDMAVPLGLVATQ